MAKDDDELFDPRTRDRIRADLARSTIPVLIGVTLVAAGLTGALHHEEPFLARLAGVCPPGAYAYECRRGTYDVLAGAIGLLLFGGMSILTVRHRRITPTVRCRSCGRRGWVMDLEPREGRCPRCAGSRFSYRIRLARGGPLGPSLPLINEPDMEGAALVQRFRETRTSMLDRYY